MFESIGWILYFLEGTSCRFVAFQYVRGVNDGRTMASEFQLMIKLNAAARSCDAALLIVVTTSSGIFHKNFCVELGTFWISLWLRSRCGVQALDKLPSEVWVT